MNTLWASMKRVACCFANNRCTWLFKMVYNLSSQKKTGANWFTWLLAFVEKILLIFSWMLSKNSSKTFRNFSSQSSSHETRFSKSLRTELRALCQDCQLIFELYCIDVAPYLHLWQSFPLSSFFLMSFCRYFYCTSLEVWS